MSEDVGPVGQVDLFGLDLLAEGFFGRAGVLLEYSDEGIEIRDSSGRARESVGRHRDDQHLGATPVEMVEVKLVGPMDQRISGLGTMPAGIAGFDIAAGQDDGREGLLMDVPRQEITGAMALSTPRRPSHPAPKRIPFKTCHAGEFTVNSTSEANRSGHQELTCV